MTFGGLFYFMSILTDTKKEEKREDKAGRKRRRELSDIRTVLKTPEGRRVIRKIMEEKCGLTTTSYTGETNSTMFNEGSRAVGTWLFKEIMKADPNAYNQINQEYESELESERRIDEMEQKQSDSLT